MGDQLGALQEVYDYSINIKLYYSFIGFAIVMCRQKGNFGHFLSLHVCSISCNMVMEMDGNISRLLFCSTIFYKLKLNGMKLG